MPTKEHSEIVPFVALFVAILGVMGITLWFYDRHSKRRVIKLINDLGYVSSLHER